MSEGVGEFRRFAGGVGVYARVSVRVEPGGGPPGVKIDCRGQGFTSQGSPEQVPPIGYDAWKAGAVVGLTFALRVARRTDVRVTITAIEGLSTDTNPAGVAAAAADGVWKALGCTPSAEVLAYVERVALSGWSAGPDVIPILRDPGNASG